MKHGRISFAVASLLLLCAAVCGPALAHESQPGLLELKQVTTDRYEVIWRAPIYYGKQHPARLELPSDWLPVVEPTVRQLPDSALHRQIVSLGDGAFDGSVIGFPGLEATITDVFVRVSRAESFLAIRATGG